MSFAPSSLRSTVPDAVGGHDIGPGMLPIGLPFLVIVIPAKVAVTPGAQLIINKRTTGNINAGGYTFETTGIFGLQFAFATPSGIFSLSTSSFVLTEDVFQHVAATYDGTMMRIYVNGVEVASQSASGAILPTTADVVIGRNSVQLSSVFDGIIDEVEYFNRALSLGEIQGIFNAGSAGKCKQEQSIVGGSFLPIDSVSLFVAGIQANAIWMIPSLIGLAGATVFYLSKKKN